jgi:ribulose-phosphate 3-epimerase
MTTRKLSIAPSILAADFSRLGEEVHAVEAGGADRIHTDIMDGHFVPNISFGPLAVKAIRPITALPFDVHLMISDPDRYLEAFAQAGADTLIPHIEVCPEPIQTIRAIHALDCQAGIAISPDTPIDMLQAVASHVDLILVMSVYPGFGGQDMLPGSFERVQAVRALLNASNAQASICIDGGIELSNIRQAVAAGADNLAVGSSVFRANVPPGEAVAQMRRAVGASG